MPLTLVPIGAEVIINKINGQEKSKSFLESLGFIPNNRITIISKNGNNFIIKVCESRVAIEQKLANKILVSEI